MVFSSNLFLFGFLPLVLLFYFLCPRRSRNIYLFATSAFFYFWGCGPVIFVYLLCVLLNFYCGRLIHNASGPGKGRLILSACLILDLAVLVYYKYFNFFSDQASFVLGWFGVEWQPSLRVALPIGVSFFVFKAMSYPIEVHRGSVAPTRKLSDFGAWLSLFPDFIAGPIVRFSEIGQEIAGRTVSVDLFFGGLTRFAVGLGKKVLIANHLGAVADKVFKLGAGETTTAVGWLGLICYTLQIYYDFSGYSDMAIGLGRMFGFHFPENFNQPYRAQNVTEFWRRWHMTLSRWFRDFLWFPLGANYRSPLRNCFNVFAVFTLCGFWHGAAWTFFCWGAYYGLLMAGELVLRERFRFKISGIPGNVYTTLAVMIGWVFFRSPDLRSGWEFLTVLLGLHPSTTGFEFFPLTYYLQRDVAFYLLAGCLFAWLPVEKFRKRRFWQTAPGVALTAIASLVLFACSAVVLSTAGFNPFIYFRF